MLRTYTEMIRFHTFEERYEYLKLSGQVGSETFGWDRYLNQALYTSPEWRQTRELAIVRDEGNDLAVPGHQITGKIIIHHINPLTAEQVEDRDPAIFDLENLVCVSHRTHEAIHYGDSDLLPKDVVQRSPGDTKLW